MSESLVTQPERQELYRGLAAWIAPSVPEIRKRLAALNASDLLETNISYLLVGQVAAMEQMLVRAGLAEEARRRGFLATWDTYTSAFAEPIAPGSRWFPATDLSINVIRSAPPSKVGGLSPEIKAAIDYLIAGIGDKLDRPDVEVLDGAGRVISRTRKVKKGAAMGGNRA